MLVAVVVIIVLAVIPLLAPFLAPRLSNSGQEKSLPPGPRGLPILGNLLSLGKNLHLDLHKLSQKHGPIMSLRIGFTRAVVVSSPKSAELFLKTHDLAFAGRPPQESMKYLAYGQKNLSFSPYGPYWRNVRKTVTLELLTSRKVNSMKPIREEGVGSLVKYLKDASRERAVVNISERIKSLTADISCRMIFGNKFEDKGSIGRGFLTAFRELSEVTNAPNVGNFFPFVANFDLQGLTKKMKGISKVFDTFLESVLDDHMSSRKMDEGSRDLVDAMLGFIGSDHSRNAFERDHVKAIILDLFIAAADTTATLAEWVMSELIRNGTIMKKLQGELAQLVGMQRTVEEFEIEALEYLNMVIKEGMRLHPPVPLLLPHMAIEDTVVNGFRIPRNTMVIVNAWSIGRDPSAWIEPEKFCPERFQGSQIDVNGQHFQLLPFGAGRRGCPGAQLALSIIRFVVAQLVHCFDWELPDGMPGTELDMTEEFGIVTTRAKDLKVIPSYRLKIDKR
ncbi:hypothetical protein MLD38_031061 [Melastoma candidum]|uniref:Uncharacterized protein n=1 Tax=Melastoma candidum TaxID=119954 RepID=A0ACB9MPQ1_9MYRT|nr:hypothetical protein MLD38_031061 [Melastoma candidum]